jgi:DNA-binding transcriptional LysR family regulator|uniref:LysR family transcriptional regulator n=1 Tax=Desulfobacca acetoxidans TaxID=60893 RepID=A0A7V6A476_9BACT
MEWQQLLGFYQVARLGSFTRAAHATFRSQSALSQQIKALEEEFDCLLLERIGKRRLRLTPAGELVYTFAENTLQGLRDLQETLNEIKGLHKGTLRFAAPFTTLFHLFRWIIKDYVAQFPQVRLTILDRSQEGVIELVKAGEIDFGVALESLVPRDLMSVRWQPVEMFLMVPKNHPLTRAKRLTMKQLAAYPLILPPRQAGFRVGPSMEDHLRKAGADYHVILESSNVELSSLYVELGLGISFATMVRDQPGPQNRNLDFIPLRRYFKPDYISIVMRKDKSLPVYKNAFLALLFGAVGLEWPPGTG